jgi:hypothetical protein
MDMRDLIRRWAYNDPIAAYWLTQARLPKDYKIEVTFTSETVSKQLYGTFPNQLSCDYFVYDVQYTTRTTSNIFVGNVLGSLSRVCGTMQPGVELDLQIAACNNIQITDGFEPIELAANSPWSGSRVIREFALFYNASLNAGFQLIEGFPAEMLPLTVTVLTKGIIMPCREFGLIDVDRACYHLKRDHGIDVPRSDEAIEAIGQKLRAQSGHTLPEIR